MNFHRISKCLPFVLVIAALLALVFVPSAFALSQRPFKEAFGSTAQPTFTNPREWPSISRPAISMSSIRQTRLLAGLNPTARRPTPLPPLKRRLRYRTPGQNKKTCSSAAKE
jgi:hypothetical protein